MERQEVVSVYTQVYNAEAYLEQCIDSVLSQSYPYLEYILVDNGSTDGSLAIMRRYAEQDRRVQVVHFPENGRMRWLQAAREYGTGSYAANLDADDWWEPDYLRRSVAFMTTDCVDIVCTGSVIHHLSSGTETIRKMDKVLVLPRSGFAEALPWYHVFFRTTWGKLLRMEQLRAAIAEPMEKLPYGTDTLLCFRLLRHARRIGIDNSVLHHYRIHGRSASYQYNPKRFEADVYLYNDAIDFLSAYGPISPQNRDFIQRVYANAVTDTVNVIRNCDLPVPDKLREYWAIAAHPLTLATYRECGRDDAVRSRKNLLLSVLQAGGELEGRNDEDLCAALQALSPRCGRAVSGAGAPLFLSEPGLLQALLQDDPEAALQILLRHMETGREVKRFAIPEMLQALAAEDPLLCQITDAAFLRQYARLYRMVWRGETLPALEEMTGLLLDGRVNGGGETFLQLYISLAATENQAPAFVFGKLQLARLYLGQGRREECRALVDELAEMGVSGEELVGLCRGLEGDG